MAKYCKKVSYEEGLPPIKVSGGTRNGDDYVITLRTSKPIIWDDIDNFVQNALCPKLKCDYFSTMNYEVDKMNTSYSFAIPYFDVLVEKIKRLVRKVLCELRERGIEVL